MIATTTMLVEGRYWYDFLVIAWIVAFFLIECVLLFRNTLIGWAMTAKCLTLAGVFFWTLIHPPPLAPESVTQEKVVIYLLLTFVLGFVIAVLIWMRLHNETVVVSSTESAYPIGRWRNDAYAHPSTNHDHDNAGD